MKYQDFLIRIGRKVDFGHQVWVTSPAGEASGRFSPPDPIAQAWRALPGLWRDIDPGRTQHLYPRLENLEAYGGHLYEAIFQGPIRDLLLHSLGRIHSSEGLGLLIKIQIEPDSLDSLEAIPWEALFDHSTMSFLALSRFTPILRYWSIPRVPRPAPASEKLEILLVLSSPRGLPSLDLEQERKNIVAATTANPNIGLHILNNATIGSLGEFLATHEVHVLHFMGNSAFDQTTGEGALVFENEKGERDLIPGTQIAWLASSCPEMVDFSASSQL
ncbi:MAG TPA: CHAT domain-containing protein [Thermoanaerobaculia bacterium]|jgi:hypothetical protein|nr:CHAT domain-containing protein [Thermoanaerobaculia bacterium]